MRPVFAIFFICISSQLFAQKTDSISLKKAIADLNTALLQKDSVALKKLLDKRVNYGHSNGWIETQRDVIEDLASGKLEYSKIDQTAPVMLLEDNTAAVRTNADVDVALNGKMMHLKLHILQVWVWENKHWQLFTRQSVKIN